MSERESETDERPSNVVDEDPLELAARVEVLAEENRRLREEYERTGRLRYRRTAGGLAVIGVLAAVSALFAPVGQEVLFALAATGLFGGVLTYYLTPDQFVAADVGERVYAASATNGAALVDELGLREDRIYVPVGPASARLFVPQRADYDVPEDGDGPIVAEADTRGLFLESTGGTLFREFEQGLTADLADSPTALAEQLTDGVAEGFDLVDSVAADVDPDGGRVTVAITGSAFGEVDRFDHPVAAFLAVGFAVGLERPVDLEVAADDGQADWLVTCRWSPEESY